MGEKINITLDGKLLKTLILAFLLSYSIIVLIQHFGKFEFAANTLDLKEAAYVFYSPLENWEHRNESMVSLMESYKNREIVRIQGGKPHYFKDKLPFYFKFSLKHIQYTLYLWFVFVLIILFRRYFHVKVKME